MRRTLDTNAFTLRLTYCSNGPRRSRAVTALDPDRVRGATRRERRRPRKLREQVQRARRQDHTDGRLEEVRCQVHRFGGSTQPSPMFGTVLSDGAVRRVRVRRKSKRGHILITMYTCNSRVDK